MSPSIVLSPSVSSDAIEPRDQKLGDVVRRQARERPARPALETPRSTWTYAQVDLLANQLAHGLHALGVRRGERVACLTRHGAECALLMIAASKLGAVCSPLNWRLAAPEVTYVLNDSKAVFLLVDKEFLVLLDRQSSPSVRQVVCTDTDAGGHPELMEWLKRFDSADPRQDAAEEDPVLQLYSSGTTGLPKGVVMSHRNLMIACWAYSRVCRIDADTRMLNSLPAFHIAGVENTLTTMIEGGFVLFQPAFDPQATVEAIESRKVSHVFLVPAMMMFVLQHPAARATRFASLKMVSYGGSPIAESVLSDAKQRFGCGLLQVYGMTEATGPITWLLPEDHDPNGSRAHLLRSAGTPSPGVEVRVVDPVSTADCSEGEVGEIWIRTRQNMVGYWQNDNATAAVFPQGRDAAGGWMRTGDAGYHREGVVYIHDRIKDMIISGGENIYPAEVENALSGHPAIFEVAVIGVPDERWGEAVKACVVLREGQSISAEALMGWVRQRLAHYKCPKSIDFLEALPRNPSGKLLKRVLRAPFWENRERQVS